MKSRKSSNPSIRSVDPGSSGGGISKNKNRRQKPNEVKSRKELRKELRKGKKAQKHNYILGRLGKLPAAGSEAEGKKKRKRKNRKRTRFIKDKPDDLEGSGGGDLTSPEKGEVKRKPGSKDQGQGQVQQGRSKVEEDDRSVDRELEFLKMEMEETRRKRLLEENDEEDRIINQLGKKLRLNKKAKVPESFRTDGLDYLLELCENSKKPKTGSMLKPEYVEEGKNKAGDAFETGDSNEEGDSDDDDDGDIGSDVFSGGSEDEEEASAQSIDVDESYEDLSDVGSEIIGDEEVEEQEEDVSDDEESDGDDKLDDDDMTESSKYGKSGDDLTKLKKKAVKEKGDGLWEDIYGRMRRKDGSVVDSKAVDIVDEPTKVELTVAASSGKYVPPMRRQNTSQREKITRSLKGLLNRLSEGNMHTISSQIEDLYMTNSRNEMNECVLELVYAVLLRSVLMPERVVLEHVMVIAILHANIGTEIGAFFIQNFVQDFRNKYTEENCLDENKELENLILMISCMYHFKIVDACLVYDILNFMAANFSPKDVELILTALRSVGFRLRKDDPIALKSLIILIQQKAVEKKGALSSAKVKFMLEVVMAIRNNNMSKIPNYDPSVGDHLLKIVKSHIHKGNYVSTLKIKMDDLLNAETKGRWWIVGSAWSNVNDGKNQDSQISDPKISKEKQKNAKLLEKASKLGMNTDTRKNVFCILMTAEDYLDAFEKLNHLDLKNNQEREIIHVTSYCCLHEKKFNPYYALVCSKFCAYDRKYMLTLQYNIWDRLKDLASLKNHQLENLAKLLIHLIIDKSLQLSTLKVIDYADMDHVKLSFLKNILTGILLQKEEENMQEIFLKSALSEKLNLFRESIRLFMCHFMLQASILTTDGKNIESNLDEKSLRILKEKIKLAENALSLGKSRVQL